MTPEVWDYIFHDNADVPQTDIPLPSLKYVFLLSLHQV